MSIIIGIGPVVGPDPARVRERRRILLHREQRRVRRDAPHAVRGVEVHGRVLAHPRVLLVRVADVEAAVEQVDVVAGRGVTVHAASASLSSTALTWAACGCRRPCGSPRRSGSRCARARARATRSRRRTPRRFGNSTDCASASRASSGSAPSSGVSMRPGAIVHTRMPTAARSRAAVSVSDDDAALRRRVRGLADLAVERGDRRGVDDHAALAVVVGLVAAPCPTPRAAAR